MSYTIEAVHHDASDRDALIEFLLNSPGDSHSEEKWRARLNHWWDNNPASAGGQPWGWTLRNADHVVGFLGCVPALYCYEGKAVPAVAATTWRVATEHRGQSLRLFMPMFQLGREMPVINASPIATVGEVLRRAGFRSSSSYTRHLLPVGKVAVTIANLMGRKPATSVRMDKSRIITNPAEASGVAQPSGHPDRLERMVSKDYLRWISSTTMDQLQFVGYTNDTGTLTSYVLLAPRQIKGLSSWLTVDWHTSLPSSDELIALVRTICWSPRLVPNLPRAQILALASFEGDTTWSAIPSFMKRPTPALYYYAVPEAYKTAPKHWVLTESDSVI